MTRRLLVVDELHVVTEAVWEAVTSVAGKRPRVVDVGDLDAGQLTGLRHVASGGARPRGDDPAFYFREYAAPEGLRGR